MRHSGEEKDSLPVTILSFAAILAILAFCVFMKLLFV